MKFHKKGIVKKDYQDFIDAIDRYGEGYYQYISKIVELLDNLKNELIIKDRKIKILDVSSGISIPIKNIIDRNIYEYYCCDLSEQLMIENQTSKKVICDAEILPFKDNSFDMIICLQATFYFENKEYFFNEASRICKGDGFVIFDIMNICSIRIFVYFLGIHKLNFIRILYKPMINLVKGRKLFHGFESNKILNFSDSFLFRYFYCLIMGKTMVVKETPSIPFVLDYVIRKYLSIKKIISYEELTRNERKYNSFRLIYICKKVMFSRNLRTGFMQYFFVLS